MQRSEHHTHRRIAAILGGAAALAAGLVLMPGRAVNAQDRPPRLEPIALEGTMKQFYRGVNLVVVTTKDGVEHIYHFTKDLIVHGGRKPGVDALEGLQEGTAVVVHYIVTGSRASAEEIDLLGAEGLLITEGTLTAIDRGRKEITIRFGNGTTETLQMTTRAAAESAASIDESRDGTTPIVIYYSDESGRKIAHYFKKKG